MNYLWGCMMIIGVVYAVLTGNLAAVTQQALDSAKDAVELCITMAGVMAFWVGMMEIAQDTGVIRSLSRACEPVLSFLFPKLKKGHPARPQIATNMVANLFGLGWAATPAGLEAMKKLQENRSMEEFESTGSETMLPSVQKKESKTIATDTMCDFLIVNISSLQLIPVNIIAYRSQYGSANPSFIIGPAILATLLSTLAAVLFIRIRHRFFK